MFDTPVIAVESVSFSFSRKTMLFQELSLQIPGGVTYGILGPNGAGKSTLMKLMLGLLRPDSGDIRIWGQPVGKDPSLFQQVGLLIEEPRLYGHLSGWDNLQVMARYRKISTERVEEVLDLVRLGYAANRLVRQYSTGMKQRLGIALALLADPELIFLDEPTNGLDPQGIAEIRQLVQRLQQEEEKTILFSSHILSEVEQICSHVAILHEGGIRFQGTLEALRETWPSARLLRLETARPTEAKRCLEGAGWEVSGAGASELEVRIGGRKDISAIIDTLREAGIDIYQLRIREDRLEDYFLRLMNETERTR